MNHAAWVSLIRFHLDQLSARNAHHEFEHLAMAFARARIASNLLPATGPVSAGGDQGRDFETFRTYIVPEPQGGPFRRLISNQTLSFACTTTKQENIANKIRDDVRATMRPPDHRAGPRPDVIYVLTTTSVSVALRHELQAWARGEFEVDLQIIDGEALAEQLADHDIHWIAATYLHLPRELAPPAPPTPPAGDEDSYTRSLSFWRSHEVAPHRMADFYEIKRASREAAFIRKNQDEVRFWMEKLAVFRERERWIKLGEGGDAPRYDSVARSAVYERALASAVGLGSVAAVHEEVRDYFAGIRSVRDPSELEDAVTLFIHLSNVIDDEQAQTGLSDEEMQRWREEIQGALDAALTSPPGPSGRCMLLESRGMLALAPAPGTDPQEAVETILDRYFEVVEAVPGAPLYPLERFADRITHVTHLLGQHPRFRELTDRVDDLLAERTGPMAAAAKARDRALEFIKSEDWLAAIGQLHHAMTKWFARETMWGSLASMLLLSECYRELGLQSAAKLYALGAAFAAMHTDQPRVLRLLPRALFNAAEAEYLQGAWLGFLQLYERIRAAFVVAYNSREAEGEDGEGIDIDVDDSPTIHVAVARDIARRIAPDVAPRFQAAIERWGELPVVDVITGGGTPWGTMTVGEIVSSCIEQIGVPPFTDVGPERTIRWSALGIDWRIVFLNTYEATARAEEFAGILQVMQAELAERELCLLPISVEIRLRIGPVQPAMLEDLRPEEGLRRFQLTVAPVPEEEIHPGEWFEREGGHLLGLAFYIFQDVSLLPRSRLMAELEWLMQWNIPGKAMIARPYHQLFTTFTTPEGFAEEVRRSGEVRRSSIRWEPSAPPALAWRDGPGPTYTPEAAAEWIGNRYRRAIIPVRLTVERLRGNPRFQRTLASLRAKGWKDWHVLLAVLNLSMNYRMNALDLNPYAEGTNGRLMGPETDETLPVPEEIFTEEALRRMIPGSQLHTISQVGLELHQQQPDTRAIDTFLSERYGYWRDDVPHEDLFGLPD